MFAVKQFYQRVIGQTLVENAKIEKFKCKIFSDFQTSCTFEMSVPAVVFVVNEAPFT